METVLLIDAYAIIHRAFFALPGLTSQDGIPTNAIYGFFSMLDKAINDFQPNRVIICFDTPKPTFRKKLYKEYQAHRPKADDGFKVQIPIIKELIDKAGILRLEKEGYEADDVIGTLSKYFSDQKKRVLILTGDKDMMQLINDYVFIISPQKGLSTIMLYNTEEVTKRFAIQPHQIPDFKALMGDPSDNYKGAKGIGPKTAAKLLQKYQTVENLLENVENMKDERLKTIIKNNLENIQISKQLATILQNVDIEIDEQKSEFHGFNQQVEKPLMNLQLYSLVQRLLKKKIISPKKEKQETADSSPQLDLFS